MMCVRRVMVAALVFAGLVALPVAAQSESDEVQVLQAGLESHFGVTLPYVTRWVVSANTELLSPPPASLRLATFEAQFRERNAASLQLSDLQFTRTGVEVVDVSGFAPGQQMNWSAFEEKFGKEAWLVRVARPLFVHATRAVVRMDVATPTKRVPLVTTVTLAKGDDGRWRMTDSVWH